MLAAVAKAMSVSTTIVSGDVRSIYTAVRYGGSLKRIRTSTCLRHELLMAWVGYTCVLVPNNVSPTSGDTEAHFIAWRTELCVTGS